MERKRQLARQVFAGVGALLLGVAIIAPASAQISEAQRSLYSARLAANSAGQFTGYAGSPLVGTPSNPTLDAIVTWDRLRRDSYTAANGASFIEYARFLKDHPDWPQGGRCKGCAGLR